jgi:hypothetical protein
MGASPDAHTVVIAEIQKTPQLPGEVHSLLKELPGICFVLTGSRARKLRHGAANLVGGRLVSASMAPLMASKLGSAFDLCRALAIGLVPLIWQATEPEANLAVCASLYLQEELQAEALVRQIGDFWCFLEVISFWQSNQLNFVSLAREAEILRKRAEGYPSILEDLLLAFRLPVHPSPAFRKDDTPLNRTPGGLMEQINASLQRGCQG